MTEDKQAPERTISGRDARQAEIILDSRRKRSIFIFGIGLFVAVALILVLFGLTP